MCHGDHVRLKIITKNNNNISPVSPRTYPLLREVEGVVTDEGRLAAPGHSREDGQLSSPMTLQERVQLRILGPLRREDSVMSPGHLSGGRNGTAYWPKTHTTVQGGNSTARYRAPLHDCHIGSITNRYSLLNRLIFAP